MKNKKYNRITVQIWSILFVVVTILIVILPLVCDNKPLVVVEKAKSNIIELNHKVDLAKAEYVKRVVRDVTVTSYNNDIAQTDNTPNITASNRPVKEGIIAVSRDMIKDGTIKYGDFVYIDCFDRWFIADDTMNERFTRRLDVFMYDKKESLKINKKCNIEVVHVTK